MNSAMLEIVSDAPDIALAGVTLSIIGPIDAGTDTPEIGRRLLTATPALLDCCEVVHSCEMTWSTPVELPRGRAFRQEDRPALESHVRELRCDLIFAASYCASAGCSGFCVWQSDGIARIYWAPQGPEFDAWLRRAIPEYAGTMSI